MKKRDEVQSFRNAVDQNKNVIGACGDSILIQPRNTENAHGQLFHDQKAMSITKICDEWRAVNETRGGKEWLKKRDEVQSFRNAVDQNKNMIGACGDSILIQPRNTKNAHGQLFHDQGAMGEAETGQRGGAVELGLLNMEMELPQKWSLSAELSNDNDVASVDQKGVAVASTRDANAACCHNDK
ncbi:unnamed protein product [Toxocara canis]|uniref:Uncharacterized protein n=1 Tax=Toxocara canis TaxID=6265 RepID=A0A3P7H200_TOXCA|nr:unnamed protein product [Toxocara canis]